MDLGEGFWVRASEVVAVAGGRPDHTVNLCVTLTEVKAKATVLLRDGRKIPAYVDSNTVAERLRAAEGGDPHAG